MSTRPIVTQKLWLLVAVLLLGGLIALVHGRTLDYGLFMDDWAHFRQLQECDWSLRGLTDACRLELVGGVVQLWWLPECTLRFFRPVSFGLMKLTYELTDWSPAAMHAASLTWHLLVCTLLLIFLRRLGIGRGVSWGVSALVALHPGHLATIQWIACQTELMVTAFLLAATLCWGRYRHWPGFTPPTADTPSSANAPTTRSDRLWLIAALLLWVLALGCRENAVLFPLVMAVAEPFSPRRSRRELLIVYGIAGTLLAGYLGLRAYCLQGVAMPPPPYVMPFEDPGFTRFIFDKVCYYLIGQFLLFPVVPIGGLPYLHEHPLLFYGSAAIVVLLLALVTSRLCRKGVGLIGPAWLVGFTIPLLPAFASPHHLYLPGIGAAIILAFVLAAFVKSHPERSKHVRRLRRYALWACVALLVTGFGLTTFFVGLAFQTGQQVEDSVTAEVATTAGGLKSGDTIYIANLPLIAHYLQLTVEERADLDNLRVIPLTWAPRLLGPATATELTWIDDHTIEVRVAGDRYFSGPLGELARRALQHGIPDEVDRMADLGLRVEVLQRDERGISAFRFVFDRPLSDPGLHLFWNSRARWAYEVYPGWQ